MVSTTVKMCLAGGLLAYLCLNLSSCATIQASLDSANDKEGGNSALTNGENIGFNVSMLWFFGASSGMAEQMSGGVPWYQATDSAWNPYDLPFDTHPAAGGEIVISPAVEFVQKGDKEFEKEKIRENYLEGQIDVLYKYNLSDGGYIYGGLGPFIGYGIGGKVAGGESSFDATDGLKRFDAGLNLKGGYAFASSLQFSLGYDLGLANRSRFPDYTSKSRNLSFSVGYSVDKIIRAFKK